MGISLAIILLTYVLLLVIGYLFIVLTNEKEERSTIIINQAYNYAFSTLFFGILVVIALVKMPNVIMDDQTTNYLILASKLVSIITLGGSLFLLSKYGKR